LNFSLRVVMYTKEDTKSNNHIIFEYMK
jgi:hypothetical protein